MIKHAALVVLLIILGIDEVPKMQIGHQARIGGIEFKALSVELRPIMVRQPGWPSARLVKSEELFTVFKFKMTNVTEEQAIDPGKIKGKMEDQFGNIHRTISGEDICDGCVINEPIYTKEMLPGDSDEWEVIFQAPKIKKAELFTIKLTFTKDNQGETGEAWIQFQRSEMAK